MEKLGAVNVAYLFKPNMTGFYLTFRAFFYGALEAQHGKYISMYLKNKARHIREFLEENGKINNDFLFSMDFSENTAVLKKHSAGTIIAKYYEAGNVPSDDKLINDLNNFLDLYTFTMNNYKDKTELSVDEWVNVLENEEIIDEKMFSILTIIYNMDNFSATTGQISQKRKEYGFTDEISYNSLIISNSRRIKEFLDKKPIFNDDGSENFWTRFFYGKNTESGFEFKMKQELVEAFNIINRTDKKDDNIGVDVMSEDNDYESFYEYLLEKGYLFDKETIENYLISLKVKPFVILTGNSGTGKTKLSQLFAQYINRDVYTYSSNSDVNSIKTEVTVGKSSNSGGWSLNRKDLNDLIPIDEFEKNYTIIVDGIQAKADLKVNPRLFYKGDELKEHLEKLAQEDARQKVPLEILLDGDKIIESNKEEYISINIPIKSNLQENTFKFSKKVVRELLNLYPYEGKLDVFFDGIRSNERLSIFCNVDCENREVLNYLRSCNSSEVNVKIRKQDVDNTFLDSSPFDNILSYERNVGKNWEWTLPEDIWSKFIPIKKIL